MGHSARPSSRILAFLPWLVLPACAQAPLPRAGQAPQIGTVQPAARPATPPEARCELDVPSLPDVGSAENRSKSPASIALPPSVKKVCDAATTARGLPGQCSPSPKGVWTIELDPDSVPQPEPNDGGQQDADPPWDGLAYEGTGRLFWTSLDGSRARLDRELSFYQSTNENRDANLVALFDYDGDGTPEIILQERSVVSFDGMEVSENTGIYTVRGGAVVPYQRWQKGLSGVEDIDGDGRPDLLLGQIVSTFDQCNSAAGSCEGGFPALFAHSLPDGTFRADDAYVREHVRRACEPYPSKPLEPATAARQVACARLRGESVDALKRRIREEIPADAMDGPFGTPLAPALLEEAESSVPFTVMPRCPDT